MQGRVIKFTNHIDNIDDFINNVVYLRPNNEIYLRAYNLSYYIVYSFLVCIILLYLINSTILYFYQLQIAILWLDQDLY